MFVERLTKDDIRKLMIKLGFGRYMWHVFIEELGLLEIRVRNKAVSEDGVDRCFSWSSEIVGFSDYDCETVNFDDCDCEIGLKGEELKLYRKFMYDKFGVKYAEAFLLGSEWR